MSSSSTHDELVSSTSQTSYTRRTSSGDKNLDLVRAMRPPADWYDPMPPEQHSCFLEEGFTLTHRGHRMLALVRSFTIRQRKGGRTACCKDGRRELALKDFGPMLGWDLSAVYKVWHELENAGLVMRDEKGGLWLCGKVVPKEGVMPKPDDDEEPDFEDEEGWKKFCTENFAAYKSQQLQQLNILERREWWAEEKRWGDFEKQALREAASTVRARIDEEKDKRLEERFGIKARRFERKTNPAAKPSMVQLSLVVSPETVFVQNSAPEDVNKPDLRSVQTHINKESNSSSNELASEPKVPDEVEQAVDQAVTESSLPPPPVGSRSTTVERAANHLRNQPAAKRPEILARFLADLRVVAKRRDTETWGIVVRCMLDAIRDVREGGGQTTVPTQSTTAAVEEEAKTSPPLTPVDIARYTAVLKDVNASEQEKRVARQVLGLGAKAHGAGE